MRRLAALFLLLPLLLSGCGGGSSTTTSSGSGTTSSTAPQATTDASAPSTDASAPASAAATPCPTENTKSFAKTRFAADLGGAAFLVRRYIYRPYTQGKFRKGASGRTFAVVKAGLAAAASVKLLRNASENAKANPTLCRTVAGPLASLSTTLSGLTSSLRSGTFNPSVLGGLSGVVGGLLSKAGQAGVPVQEKPTSIG